MGAAHNKKSLVVAIGLSCVLGGSFLYAQNQDSAQDTLTVPMEKQATLSPQEMLDNGDQLIKDMQKSLARLVELAKVARDAQDVIKLNCVNDKILQVKQLLKIAETSRTNLVEAVAQDDEEARYHEYGKIVIASQQVKVLEAEGDECIGEELVFIGPTEVDVDEPAFPDDPFEPGDDGIDIEPPAWASPFA